MERRLVLWVMFVLMGSSAARAAERLRWDELESRIVKKKVAFALPDGARLEGKVIAVEPDGLRFDVSKSSDKKAHPKGKQLISRHTLNVLQVTDYGKKGRIIGALAAAAIAGGIVAAQSIDVYEGPLYIIVPVLAAGGIGGAAIGGYYAGKAYDKRVTEIWISPEVRTNVAR